MTRKTSRWCLAWRVLTGPDKIHYGSKTFSTREEAEKEQERLSALPENAGRRFEVAIVPEQKTTSERLRKRVRGSRR